MDRAVETLGKGRIVVLAGPGLLEAAGLVPPEVRGGLWDRFDPLKCATPEALVKTPERAWEAFSAYLAQVESVLDVGVSAAHRALLSLFEMGLVRGVICTTTDGLVRRSGIGKVAELFGAVDKLVCTGCRARSVIEGGFAGYPPVCGECGEKLRPDMVLFGEAMTRGPREVAASWVYGGRSLLVLGADLTRPPIHRIPEEMFGEGGLTVAIGDVAPGAVGRVRGVHLEGSIGRVLPEVVERIAASRGEGS